MQEKKYRLIGTDGRPNFGTYDMPLMELNIDELRPYGKERYSRIGRAFVKNCRIKRWQYIGITNRDMVFGSAIVSTGYLGNVFLYLFDRTSAEIFELSFIRPFASNIRFEGGPYEGTVSFETSDNLLRFIDTPGNIILKFKTGGTSADIIIRRDCEPLSVVVRDAMTGFNYTDKEAGLPAEGTIHLKGRKYRLNNEDSFAVLDYTLGYLSRETFWNWASGGGFLEDKRRVGFNISLGINESGTTENVFWINGKMNRLGGVNFIYSDLDIMKEWRIFSSDGEVDLSFAPEGMRKANINAFVIKSRFFQPFGRFTGFIKENQKRLSFKDVYGFTEEHYARW